MRNEIVELYLDDIIPNRFQPREKFDEDALTELSNSIKEHGVIQPIIVRKIDDKYEIIAGERRYKASALAGLTKVPAIIRNLDDKEASKVALLENLQRKDLTAIEEARTYQKILELDSMTQDELGKTMGKSQASIANKLRLLSLTDEVQEALLNDQISERHARSLLNITNGNQQIEMLNRVIRERMTVRELDNEIKRIKDGTQMSMNLENDLFTQNIPISNQNSSIIEQQPNQDITSFINDTVMMPKDEKNNSSITSSEQINMNNQDLPLETITEPIGEKTSAFISPIPVDDEFRETLEDNTKPIIDKEFIDNFKYQDAVNLVKNIIPEIKNKGIKADIQEFDLDGKYQIVINIDKNNM